MYSIGEFMVISFLDETDGRDKSGPYRRSQPSVKRANATNITMVTTMMSRSSMQFLLVNW
jgi:hypothetical protein